MLALVRGAFRSSSSSSSRRSCIALAKMASTRCDGTQAASPIVTPKVELHIHLDGSLRPDTLHDIAKNRGMVIGSQDPSEIRKYCLYHEEDEHSLKRFLDTFYYFLPIVRGDAVALERVAYEFCEDQASQGIIYSEPRYSPHLLATTVEWEGMVEHEFCSETQRKAYNTAPKLSPDEVVCAINAGLNRGMKDLGITAKSILCCITGRPELSMEVVRLAEKHRGDGVVGVDLAGFEKAVPMEEHQKAFELAKELGIHRTVHAGEVGNAENVRKAIEILHAERIGHGYAIVKDEGVYSFVAQQRTHLEACIYSSHCTGALTTLDQKRHPVARWCADGLNCSLSTDDPGVMQFKLSDDFDRARKEGLTNEDLIQMSFNAAQSSFLPEAEKARLLASLKEEYYASL